MISLSYTTDLVLTNEKLHIRFIVKRILQLEETFKGYLVQLPDHFGAHQKLLKAVSKCPLNTGRHKAPATSLGSLLQPFTTLMGKKCPLLTSLSSVTPVPRE